MVCDESVRTYKFTGKERDSETGLDYFGARYYGSNLGRWMSPDWAEKPTAIPYADFPDPQTLNLYGYVRNNPLSKPDLDGHCDGFTPCDELLNNLPLPTERTAQGIKGAGQVLFGATLIVVGATSANPVGIVAGLTTGPSLVATGVANIAGAATNTDVKPATDVLSATQNPAGLAVTAATGGNLQAGQAAALAQSAVQTGIAMAQAPDAANTAKGVNVAVGIGTALANTPVVSRNSSARPTAKPPSVKDAPKSPQKADKPRNATEIQKNPNCDLNHCR